VVLYFVFFLQFYIKESFEICLGGMSYVTPPAFLCASFGKIKSVVL